MKTQQPTTPTQALLTRLASIRPDPGDPDTTTPATPSLPAGHAAGEPAPVPCGEGEPGDSGVAVSRAVSAAGAVAPSAAGSGGSEVVTLPGAVSLAAEGESGGAVSRAAFAAGAVAPSVARSGGSEVVTLPSAGPRDVEEDGTADSVAALLAPFAAASVAGAARAAGADTTRRATSVVEARPAKASPAVPSGESWPGPRVGGDDAGPSAARLVGAPDRGASPGAYGAGVTPGESITQVPPRAHAPRRRGPADPVRAVMHRYHALVAGAVDAWEVAAGLEACGLSDGEARRLRHRDVFGLAEELYARVPRSGRVAVGAVRPAPAGRRMSGKAVAVHLLPGAGCVLAAGLPVAAAPVAVVVALALWWALRHGPLRIAGAAGAAPWTYGLLGFALYGPQALTALAGRGRFDAGAGIAAFAALALSLLPGAGLARWFAAAARAQLAPSHGLADFADAVRPRLAAALAGYAAALAGLLLLAAAMSGPSPFAGPLALGVLLFTARLLTAHGHPAPAAAALAAACTAEALTFALAAAPGDLAPPGTTAEAAVCTCAALVLTVQALRLLGRAAAHRPRP